MRGATAKGDLPMIFRVRQDAHLLLPRKWLRPVFGCRRSSSLRTSLDSGVAAGSAAQRTVLKSAHEAAIRVMDRETHYAPGGEMFSQSPRTEQLARADEGALVW